MYPPGLRLRQTREALGLTYRDVEKASYQIAVNRGRPDFILHISRLADIENRGVVPSLHKVYSLAAILHLDPGHSVGTPDFAKRATLSKQCREPVAIARHGLRADGMQRHQDVVVSLPK